MHEGKIQLSGNIQDVIDSYISKNIEKGVVNNFWDFDNAPGYEKIRIKSAYIQYEGNKLTVKTPFDIVTEFWCLEEGFPVNVSIHLYSGDSSYIFSISTDNRPLKSGLHKAVFHIPANLMNDGIYSNNNYFITADSIYFNHENAHSFEIEEEREISGWHGKWGGAIRPTFIKCELT
jgi:lipopolysaccharide transport system ATP-binding protein